MGIVYDYFRAADDQDALRVVEYDAGPRFGSLPGLTPFDAVAAPGVDPVVVLGQLLAFVLAQPWHVDLVPARSLWPVAATSPEPPLVFAVGRRARDVLATVCEEDLPELAGKWAGIAELPGWQPLPVLTELVALAQRAVKDGDRLFCWCTF
ncbi:hypothetical protein JOF53_000253 [Crossiella equi]|uniref:Uncharacterized protein n=1 Tax=Crossiella equi TaxID=130796 RepID=A0ABS5A479_9PSEU|nr:hypothetical protein [Crossiella equi]MBP2471381.1 hypothetical protein [Crossiella equi]